RLGPAETGGGFEARMKEASAAIPVSSQELLGLGGPQPGDPNLLPPPRPMSFSYADIDEDRRRWHGLLSRHTAGETADPGVGRRLTLLAELQDEEDAGAARTLWESRG